MDVVGPDVGVIFLPIVETVDFVVNNVEKWDELWLVLEMRKITRKSYFLMFDSIIYQGIVWK